MKNLYSSDKCTQCFVAHSGLMIINKSVHNLICNDRGAMFVIIKFVHNNY
jgi:hypothetical protein